jgi:hypothetical protein
MFYEANGARLGAVTSSWLAEVFSTLPGTAERPCPNRVSSLAETEIIGPIGPIESTAVRETRKLKEEFFRIQGCGY